MKVQIQMDILPSEKAPEAGDTFRIKELTGDTVLVRLDEEDEKVYLKEHDIINQPDAIVGVSLFSGKITIVNIRSAKRVTPSHISTTRHVVVFRDSTLMED